MDYMRELATKTLPWFGIDRSADAPAPRNERGEAIDRDEVRLFVDDVQSRVEKYDTLPAWLAFLKAANLHGHAAAWASLWQSGTEQARVELLADLYYIDASACKDAAVYDVGSAYANPDKRAKPSGTSNTKCLAERAASLLDLTPSLIKEVILANHPSEWDEEPTSEDVAGERGRWIQSPRDVRNTVKDDQIAAPFELVLEKELAAIARSRVLREATDLQGPIEDARRHIDQIRREVDLARAAGAPTPPSGVPIAPVARGAEAPKELDDSPKTRKDIVDELPTRRATLQSELNDWTERLKLLLASSPPGDMPAVPGAAAGGGGDDDGRTVTRYAPRRAEEMNLLGLSFSGGGIRSATFNLGILQALADFDLLRRFDYLSTVSGGGYIGAWLAGCIKREDDGIRGVQRWLSSERSPDPEAPQRRPLRFLREYSNYLTPSIGFLSADSWTMVAIWLRNTLLNQLVLVLFLGAALLLPIVLGSLAFAIDQGWDGRAVALCIERTSRLSL